MMKAEKALRFLLVNDAGVLAQISATSIYPVIVPKGSQPSKYIVYSMVSNVPKPTIDALASYKLYQARIQITVGASDYVTLKALAQSVKDALHLKRGLINTVSVVTIQLALEGMEDFDEGSNIFFQPIDFMIIYTE